MKNHYKFWIILSFLLVFTAGVFSGILLDKYALNKDSKDFRERSDDHRKRPGPFPMVDELSQILDLSAEQKENLKNIFDNNEERLKAMGKEYHERFSTLRTQFLNEIKSILDEDQIAKFDAMIEEHIAKIKKEFENKRKHPPSQPSEKGEDR
ncbi:MAG: hypothetical protein JW755_04630 [Candidatus Aminicenantes bacterium]|nr:hypothetical protein [Candidatus Aminicenantes bacterium]